MDSLEQKEPADKANGENEFIEIKIKSDDIEAKIDKEEVKTNTTNKEQAELPQPELDTDEVMRMQSTNSIINFCQIAKSRCAHSTNLLEAGSLKGATFTLIISILSSGTVSLPYLAAENGIVLSCILITFGAVLSYFCSMLLVSCAVKLNKSKYEDFASHCYGRNMEIFVGWCNLITLMGFVVAYIVFIKTLIPQIIEIFVELDSVPSIFGDDQWNGGLFWATVYFVLFLIPMSIPRKINTLRFCSLFGVLCSIYLVICLVLIFFCDRDFVPDMKTNLQNALYFNVTFGGMIRALPYINYVYMYQPNIPIIYRELNEKSYNSMHKVIFYGSGACVVMYILASTFGYLELVEQPEGLAILDKNSDILKIEYNNWTFDVAIVALMLSVFAGSPLCVLPSKDTIEDLFYHEQGMSDKENVFVSFMLSFVAYALAVAFPDIGDVITLCGCTVNPLIGFIFPCLFYLKICNDADKVKRYNNMPIR